MFPDSPLKTCVSSLGTNQKFQICASWAEWRPYADGDYVSEGVCLQKSLSEHRTATFSVRQVGKGALKKPPKNAQHSPLSVRAMGAAFTGRVHFRALLHREFQVTAMTVNNTKNNRGGLILLSKKIPVDGHGGHLQTPMYGNVPCAPNATRRPAIQRPATQQPANRRPATQRPTTSNSQPRVRRPEGGGRPGSKSPEAGDHAARVQEGGQEARGQKAGSPEAQGGQLFRTEAGSESNCCKYSRTRSVML